MYKEVNHVFRICSCMFVTNGEKLLFLFLTKIQKIQLTFFLVWLVGWFVLCKIFETLF